MKKKNEYFLIRLARMGNERVASVLNFVLNPSSSSSEALDFMVEIGDLSRIDRESIEKFAADPENATFLREVVHLTPSKYEELAEKYGDEVVDFFAAVMQQVVV